MQLMVDVFNCQLTSFKNKTFKRNYSRTVSLKWCKQSLRSKVECERKTLSTCVQTDTQQLLTLDVDGVEFGRFVVISIVRRSPNPRKF